MSNADETADQASAAPGRPPQALEAMARASELAKKHARVRTGLEQLLANAEQQRAGAAHLAAQVRSLLARGRDLRTPTEAVREAIDRTRIVALNAGLEGSRLPESEGRALLMVGEEIRGVAVQAEGALDELLSLLSQIDGDRQALSDSAERMSLGLASYAESLEQLVGEQRSLEALQTELVEELAGVTGTDPEVARLAVQASDQAKGLLKTLQELATQRGAGSALGSFKSELAPLYDLVESTSPSVGGKAEG